MRYVVFMIVFTLLTVAILAPNDSGKPVPSGSKNIAAKQMAVEYVEQYDLMTSRKIVIPRNAYYLIADDGTCIDVGLSEFYRVKEGDSYMSYDWKVK